MHDAVPASGRGHAKDDRVACLHSQRIQGRGGYKTLVPLSLFQSSTNTSQMHGGVSHPWGKQSLV